MDETRSVTIQTGITADNLVEVSRTKVFFGHQSVGMNLLDAVSGVYAAHGVTPPPVELDAVQPDRDGGHIGHAFIGENEKPWLKIQDFAAKMRSDVGQWADVALMKLCYVDITYGMDTGALFALYRETLTALEREFPKVAFVHITVPLMMEQGHLSKLKSRLTGNTRYGPAENVARERLNARIRREYAGGRLLDLAAIESTRPDGSRAVGRYQGQRYYHLHGGYASDSGHLNGEGARIAATAWLRSISQAGR
jgi:hypothetical protein